MTNISEAENNYLSNQYSINPRKGKKTGESEKAEGKNLASKVAQKTEEGGEEEQEKEVLSTDETTTLHMLFGSSKPEEMQFYTKNKIDQISKGHLLDLEG